MKEGPKTLFIQKVIFDSSGHPVFGGMQSRLVF
jgi:hypothetical protein